MRTGVVWFVLCCCKDYCVEGGISGGISRGVIMWRAGVEGSHHVVIDILVVLDHDSYCMLFL